MAISKLILNGEVQMDVTSDTVTAGSMLSGTTATKNDGTKATGNIATKTSSDLTASGATVTAPAGYYANAASKAVATATHPNPTASINSSTGLVTASHTQGTGYVTGSTTTGTLQLTTQAAATITPSTASQTAVAANRYTTGTVTVAAMPTGTAGTPTATKGAVSNYAVSVTPSVTNTTGYITGGTKTGTAVTVSASELVSGAKSITENGTSDVTNYASVNVNVPSSGGDYFVVTFTRDQNDEWKPDCTYSEFMTAYNAGKTILTKCEGYTTEDPYNGAFANIFICPDYYVGSDAIGYEVDYGNQENYGGSIYRAFAALTSNSGVVDYYEGIYPAIYLDKPAQPHHVIIGREFYNLDGWNEGTLNEDLIRRTATIVRAGATTGSYRSYVYYNGTSYSALNSSFVYMPYAELILNVYTTSNISLTVYYDDEILYQGTSRYTWTYDFELPNAPIEISLFNASPYEIHINTVS